MNKSTPPMSAGRRSSRLAAGLALALILGLAAQAALAEVGPPEKEDLKFGFIKLTDMAPLAIAYEKQYFEDEGLYVTLGHEQDSHVLPIFCPPTTAESRRPRMRT